MWCVSRGSRTDWHNLSWRMLLSWHAKICTGGRSNRKSQMRRRKWRLVSRAYPHPPLKKKSGRRKTESKSSTEQVDEALKKGGGRWWEDRSRRDREMRDERRSERLTEQSIIQPGEMSSSVTWCNAGNEQRAPTAGREEGDTQTQRAHRHTTSLVYSCSTALSREHWSQSPWLHHTHVRLL